MTRSLRCTILGVATLIAACDRPAPGPSVGEAWTRPTPAGETAAAYFSISNPSDSLVEVTGVSSEVAASASLHQSMDHEGSVMMHGIEVIPVPAKQTFTLLPGGTHVMLEKVRRELRAGDTFTLTVRTRRDSLTVLVSVRP